MDKQMNKLFAEGGINTEETNVDPVSGNEVPPGSLPSEVRDDVDAKLSGGEYVVPADVLRYYGVSFFEKLRKKAKEGLGEMDAEGRIGGGKPEEEEEEDDFPFSVEELEAEDEMAFAEGGTVPTQAPAATGFNPEDWSYGSTNVMGQASGGTQIKKYKDKDGNVVQVLFINGKPVIDVEALGYTEYKEETPVATGEDVKAPEAPKESSSDRNDDPPPEAKPIDPAENYYNLSEQDLLNPEYSSLKDNKTLSMGAKIGTALLGPGIALGAGAVNGFQQAQNLADVRARKLIAQERGFDTTALDAKIKEMEDSASGIVKGLDFIGLDGTGIAKRHKEGAGVTPTVAPTTSGVVSRPASSAGGSNSTRASSNATSSNKGSGDGYTAPSFSSEIGKDKLPSVGATSTASTGGKSVVGYSPSVTNNKTTGNKTAVSSYTKNASDYSLGKSEVNQNAYDATANRKKGPFAKGGLVEKPKKVTPPRTKRKTKI